MIDLAMAIALGIILVPLVLGGILISLGITASFLDLLPTEVWIILILVVIFAGMAVL